MKRRKRNNEGRKEHRKKKKEREKSIHLCPFEKQAREKREIRSYIRRIQREEKKSEKNTLQRL